LSFSLVCIFGKGTQENTEAAAKEKPEISVAILDRGKVPAEKGSYENNDVTEWINKHAPVNVKYIAIPRWETRQKYSLLLASGNPPDIMMEYSFNLVQDFVNQGVLMELKDVVDENGPNIRALTPPDTAKLAIFNGGEYCVPSIRPIKANWNLMVRKDWLDDLGISTPKTTEEFYQAAKAMKNSGKGWGYDLQGRGAQGIGLVANMFGVMNNWWTLVDGELELGYATEQYRDAIALCAKMYQEGIVDPEYFTDKGGVKAEQTFVNGNLGFFATNRIKDIYPTLKKNVPEAEVVPVKCPKSPYGQFAYYQETAAGYLNMIPKDSKKAAEAVQFLDWMMTDGWEWIIYGEEGVHYKEVDGVKINIASPELIAKDLIYRRDYAIMDQDIITPNDYLIMHAGEGVDPAVREGYEIYVESLKVAESDTFERILPTNGLDVKLYTELSQDLNKFGQETWTKAILGEMTVDQALDKIRKEYNNLGYMELKKAINESAVRFNYIE
jgi:putative aldouronate transport system substrate-binding protein